MSGFDRSQLRKGTLEGCILQIIARAPNYGYAIADALRASGFQDVNEGTLYPLLLRLERKNLIRAFYRASPSGPSRKYYDLTEAGRQYLQEFLIAGGRPPPVWEMFWRGRPRPGKERCRMWANEYGALKKQNRKRFDALCLADRNTITVAMESIQNASWNLYEVERVRKDLIDMAEKAKEEGKTLAEALGPDRRRVFDEMAREIESGDFVDWLCQYGSWYYLPFHAGVVLFQALLGQTEHLMLLVLLTPMFLLTAFGVACLRRKIWVSASSREKREMLMRLVSVVVILLVFGLAFLAMGTVEDLGTVSAVLYAGLDLLIFFGSRLLSRFRYNQTARRHPWR